MKKNIFLSILGILFIVGLCVSLNVNKAYAWSESSSGADNYDTKVYENKNATYHYDEIQVCKVKQVIDTCKIVGKLITVLKLLVPVILVIVSFKSLAVALVEEDDTDIKKFTKIFIQRCILAVFVFFIPTLVDTILSYTTGDGYDTVHNDYVDCASCIMNPESCPSDSQLYVLNPESTTGGSIGANEYVKYSDISGEIDEATCSGMLGSTTNPKDLAYYVQMAFTIMKYVGIVLCIVFSVLEILKAVMGGDKDMYKPVVSKTIKRLCYAAVLLFLPQMLDAIMTITGLYSSCGIK